MSNTYRMTSTFLLIVLIVIFLRVRRKLEGHEHRKISLMLIGSTVLYVLMDYLWLSEYLRAEYRRSLFTVLNFFFYAVYITLPFIWFRFSHSFISEKTSKQRLFNILTAVPWLFNVVLIVLTILGMGTVWVIGPADNRYARGPMFSVFSNLNLVYYFIPVFEIIVNVIRRHQNKARRYYLSTLWFSLVPALGVFFYTYFIPEMDIYPFQPFCFCLGIMFAYFFLLEQLERTYQLEQERLLNEAAMMAQSSNKAKTEFLFNMSHDIRTPMNAILGYTDMAEKSIGDTGRVQDCLRKIKQSGNLLLSLINSVLEMSRIESGKAEINELPGAVDTCFDDIRSTMTSLAEKKNIQLTFEIADIRDNYVLVDVDRINRVFVNIISNAIKYTSDGGHVNVHCTQLGRRDDNYGLYRFTFTDDGIGMSEEFQKHVFDEFARENSATVSGVQGSGLGLSVVNTFVRLMNGTITCTSKLNEGSTFVVTLPFRLQSDAEKASYVVPGEHSIASVQTSRELPEKKTGLEGKRVLLAEDNELNREIAVFILREAGMNVDTVCDGTEAVERLKKDGAGSFDVILMDIQMPNMNGYEATKAIRKMYPGVKLPIIALSANAFAEDKAASLDAGMNGHIAKPINTDELYATLSHLL